MKNETKKTDELAGQDVDTEYADELTGEEYAVKKVQIAFFEMYAQAGYHDKEKE